MSECSIKLCRVVGPARCEQGDEAVLIDLVFDQIHTKALVDTGASSCFMAIEFRAKLPGNCFQDAWEVEKGTISLVDNSCLIILEQS